MPDEPIDVEIEPAQDQRHQRAERGERQAGENRDRVDEALVQHAEDDVDHEHREEHQQDQALLRRHERLRDAREARGDGARAAPPPPICCTAVSAVPSDTPGARLNDTVTDGSWPE